MIRENNEIILSSPLQNCSFSNFLALIHIALCNFICAIVNLINTISEGKPKISLWILLFLKFASKNTQLDTWKSCFRLRRGKGAMLAFHRHDVISSVSETDLTRKRGKCLAYFAANIELFVWIQGLVWIHYDCNNFA